jgi:hypothetical protein
MIFIFFTMAPDKKIQALLTPIIFDNPLNINFNLPSYWA